MARSISFAFLFVLLLSSHVHQSSAFQAPSTLPLLSRAKAVSPASRALQRDQLSMSTQPGDRLKSAAFGFLLAAGLALGAPGDALAARSGARVGGGSFRAPRAAPARPAPQAQQQRSFGGGVAVAPPPVIVSPSPFGFSPFGYSPFGFSPFGFSPFGFFRPVVMGPSLTDILVLGGVAYAGYKIYEGVQNARLGTSAGVTVAKLQVAVNCDERGASSLLGTLGRLGRTADTSSQSGVSSLVSDTALALLRKEADWVSASLDTAGAKDADAGERKFGEYSLRERAKIERETLNKVGGKDKSEGRGAEEKADEFGSGTLAVVTLVLALQGRALAPVTDMKSLKDTLMTLGSDVLDNESLLAAEVMWTPEEPWERITPDDVTLDYPNLIPL